MSTKALRKELLAAIAMVIVAAIALSGSTYAWFSLNTTVKAENMQVTAVAEKGLLINEVATHDSASWDSLATTSQTEGVSLHATSTANTSTWYVAYSKSSSSSASASQNSASTDLTEAGYTDISTITGAALKENVVSAVAGTTAKQDVYYIDGDGDSAYDNGEGYYAKYTYYLKSSGEEITCALTQGANNVNISSVEVTGSASSAALNASLRVAVVMNNKAYIFAPVRDSEATYYVAAGNSATTAYLGDNVQSTGLVTVPASTADGIPVYIYVYFEGEDAGLKSENVTETLDTLNVSVKFSLVENETAVTDNGVSLT